MIRGRQIISTIGIACALFAINPNRAEAVDRTWRVDYVSDGYASVAANWDPYPYQVPGADDKAILPYRSAGAYTVTLDVSGWTIDDFEVGANATALLGGNTLNCGSQATIDGTLNVGGGHYYGSINLDGTLRMAGGSTHDSISTTTTSRIYGYGYLYDDLANNDGEVQAQGGQLQIALAGNDHDDGVLSAAEGATLFINDDAAQRNRATIRLDGGTLRGYSASTQLNNEGASSQTAYIKGWGTIDDFLIVAAAGSYSRIDADGSGLANKTLALNEGFYDRTNYCPINISNGTTFSVTQSQSGVDYWNQDGTVIMTGGGIAGEQLRQRGTLTASSGTNSIQNAIFYGHVGTTTVNGGAALQITGTAYFDSSAGTNAIAGTGSLRINGAGASFSGSGQIAPNVYVDNGSLIANVNGAAMRLLNNLTVSTYKSAYAESGGTLRVDGAVTNSGYIRATGSGSSIDLNGSVSNSREIYASGSGATATLDNTVSNHGYIYAVGGGQLTASGSVANYYDSGTDKIYASGSGSLVALNGAVTNNGNIYAANGATLNLTGDVKNSSTGVIHANGGSVNVSGTIKDGYSGDFRATGATLSISASIEPGADNYFSAAAGGTVKFASSLDNSILSQTGALRLWGGTITLSAAGQTLTNAAGKTISGYGTILESGHTLHNYGLLDAAGSLALGGDAVNYSNAIRADSAGDSLTINGTLTNLAGGLVQLGDGASLDCGSAAGGGTYSLLNATLVVNKDFSLDADATIDDGDVAGSLVRSLGNLENRSAGGSGFDADQITLQMLNRAGEVGDPNVLCWLAEDRGASTGGLTDNMAVGTLVFGDGLGSPRSEAFELIDDSTIYAFGLVLEPDASLDLGGRTIYYLRAGVEVNGLVGQGFKNLGEYYNGEIVEIVPEPSALVLLVVGGVFFLWARRWKTVG